VLLDTPADLPGKLLDAVLRIAQTMLIPLQPSLFDIHATHALGGGWQAEALTAAAQQRRVARAATAAIG
jgi:cellulose biosynthesis protein BcsQ